MRAFLPRSGTEAFNFVSPVELDTRPHGQLWLIRVSPRVVWAAFSQSLAQIDDLIVVVALIGVILLIGTGA